MPVLPRISKRGVQGPFDDLDFIKATESRTESQDLIEFLSNAGWRSSLEGVAVGSIAFQTRTRERSHRWMPSGTGKPRWTFGVLPRPRLWHLQEHFARDSC